jgi:hypothetical protein
MISPIRSLHVGHSVPATRRQHPPARLEGDPPGFPVDAGSKVAGGEHDALRTIANRGGRVGLGNKGNLRPGQQPAREMLDAHS